MWTRRGGFEVWGVLLVVRAKLLLAAGSNDKIRGGAISSGLLEEKGQFIIASSSTGALAYFTISTLNHCMHNMRTYTETHTHKHGHTYSHLHRSNTQTDTKTETQHKILFVKKVFLYLAGYWLDIFSSQRVWSIQFPSCPKCVECE